eukprot:TRINITY_DN2234_c0_g1_i1.p1 TRINITY_DN2234_c0_g1~~TRINITY_DN2234_c0_g1_i1.p1  ORF type:complete len:808 (-),score=104.56 TRINITY_DN2234_c0_g1_i1:32-2455(-)
MMNASKKNALAELVMPQKLQVLAVMALSLFVAARGGLPQICNTTDVGNLLQLTAPLTLATGVSNEQAACQEAKAANDKEELCKCFGTEDDCEDGRQHPGVLCGWTDGSCTARFFCGKTVEKNCEACGVEDHCHGECYWNGETCINPNSSALRIACGYHHRASKCSECMTVFSRLFPGEKQSVGCQGQCHFNYYTGECSEDYPVRPNTVHPDCQLNRFGDDCIPPEDPPVSGVANWLTAAGQELWQLGIEFLVPEKAQEPVRILQSVGNVFRAQNGPPCAQVKFFDKYDEDEYWQCMWEGIAPFVASYVEDVVAEAFGEYMADSFEAEIIGVANALQSIGTRSEANETDLPLLISELDGVHMRMQETMEHFMKPGAPAQTGIYLNLFAHLHMVVINSLRKLNATKYEGPEWTDEFVRLLSNYMSRIRTLVEKEMDMRREATSSRTTSCSSHEVCCSVAVPGVQGAVKDECHKSACQSCSKTLELEDTWPRCLVRKQSLAIGECEKGKKHGNGCDRLSKVGECEDGASFDTCNDGAWACKDAYQAFVENDNAQMWHDFALSGQRALSNEIFYLTGEYPNLIECIEGSGKKCKTCQSRWSMHSPQCASCNTDHYLSPDKTCEACADSGTHERCLNSSSPPPPKYLIDLTVTASTSGIESQCQSGYTAVTAHDGLNGNLNQGVGKSGADIFFCAAYDSVGPFITNIRIAKDKSLPQEDGWRKVEAKGGANGDLNQEANGEYIYATLLEGQKENAITELGLYRGSENEKPCDGACPSGWKQPIKADQLNGDLNEEAGGEYICLCFSSKGADS